MSHENQLNAEENIRTRAYLMWELEGKQDGRAQEYWLRAAERIAAEKQSAYPPVQSISHRL